MQKKSREKRWNYQNFELAPFPIVISVGPRLLVEFVNQMALPLMKQSLESFKGEQIENVWPEIFTKEIVQKLNESCFVNQLSFVIKEKQILSVSGQNPVKWFDIVNTPMYDDKGTVVGVIGYFREISNKFIPKNLIDERDPYLVNFFKLAPIGLVCYRGPDFIVDLANEKALEMWGKTIDEVKGKAIFEIFPEVLTNPEINKRHKESQERLKKGETHIVNEVQLTFNRNGLPKSGWYNYIHEPYTNAAGEIVGMMAIAIEVTDQVLSRMKLQLITDTLPSLISYINSGEEYEFVNKAYETWFGRSRDEVVGRTISQVVGEDAYEKIKHHVDKALAGETDSFENWISYSDGNRRFVSANYIPHLDDSKRVLGYVGLVNDLTERKRYEEVLQENEARLRLVIEGTGGGTFEYDLKIGTINGSPELKSLLGLPADFFIDTETARSIVHPEDIQRVLRQVDDLKNPVASGFMAIDFRIIRNDNREVRWLHSRCRVLYVREDGKEVASRLIGFSIDVTDQKAGEEKLKEFNQNLEHKVQDRTVELKNVNQLLTERNDELNKTHAVLQQLIDSSPELIVVIDRELKFLTINKTFEEFVNKSRASLIGKEIFDAYSGARGTPQALLLEKVLQGERFHIKINPSIARPNVWFDTHYVPLVINEKVEGVIVLSRDITDIVKSEQELANANRQLQEAQRLTKLGSWEWNLATGRVLWSDEMYRIYGYDEKFEVDFVKATERMSPEHAERSSKRTQEHIQHVLELYKSTGEQTYEIPSIEFPIQLPTGERKLLRSTGRIQLTGEGKVDCVIGALQDVTEIRSAEEKLRQLVSELEEKNRELESFSYVASHDLKEPLRKIQNYIDRIKNSDGVDANNYLERINGAAKRMADLIESILTLSQVSNADLHLVDVDLNRVLDNCRSDLEVKISDTHAKIVSDKLPIVKASEFQMIQVFSNLLSNSLKFCEKSPIIRISCDRVPASNFGKADILGKGQYWRLKFSDNGIGFDPQFKHQIFEPFQRLHAKGKYSGTGIGLSTVKKLIERHAGFIDVESAPGMGTTFTIFLP